MKKIILMLFWLLIYSSFVIAINSNECIIDSDDFSCEGISILSESVEIKIKNNLGRDSIIPIVMLPSGNCVSFPSKGYEIKDSETITIPLPDCVNGPPGSTFESLLRINYDDLKYSREVRGNVVSVVGGNISICGEGICSDEEKTAEQTMKHFLTFLLNERFSKCHDMTFVDLLKDCYNFNSDVCSETKSCDFITTNTPSLINKKLNGLDYKFSITTEKVNLINIDSDCNTFNTKKYPIPMDTMSKNLSIISLSICTPTCLEDCFQDEIDEHSILPDESSKSLPKQSFFGKIFGWIKNIPIFSGGKFSSPEKTIKTLEKALNSRKISTSFDAFFYDESFLKENNLDAVKLKGRLVDEYNELKDIQKEKDYRQVYDIISSEIEGDISSVVIKKCIYSDEWETNQDDCGQFTVQLIKINKEWKIDASTAKFFDGFY